MAKLTVCFNLFVWITLAAGRIRLEDEISKEDLERFRHIEKAMREPGLVKALKHKKVVDDTICMTDLMRLVLRFVPIVGPEVDAPVYIKTTFVFYSRRQPAGVKVESKEKLVFGSVDFDRERLTVILIHGYMSHCYTAWVQEMVAEFLSWADVNIIAVDWSKGQSSWKYWLAVMIARHVGSDVAGLYRRLKTEEGADIKRVYCVGHSVGAHICGVMSTNLGGIGRITGLDPALPCFNTTESNRLSRSDAGYVDVIHTNVPLMESVGLGYPHPIGTSDFYPNAGRTQPGCESERQGSNWISDFRLGWLSEAICSHGRAHQYFIQSLKYNKGNCSFEAVPWSPDKPRPSPNPQTPCDKSWCPEMGINAVGSREHLRAEGTYFVDVQEEEPYCRMTAKIKKQKHERWMVHYNHTTLCYSRVGKHLYFIAFLFYFYSSRVT